MTDLKTRLKAMIETSGPVSVATYMDLCLHDRRHGYYATRPGLGSDFTTAPETSQIFGELIGVWAAHEWQQMGAPNAFNLVEIGPGRGTLMADALRATQSVPGFHAALQLCFVEPSPVLRTNLNTRFVAVDPVFLSELDTISTDRPFVLIANEWLDCLPMQQYVRVGAAWHERVIGLNESNELTFGLKADALPADLDAGDDREAIEVQPGLKTLSETLKGLFDQTKGRALLIDYGPSDHSPSDTLRAYKNGNQIHPLAAPGESDLTCDVDFARLRRLAVRQGLQVNGPISQSQFLLTLGAEARLNQLAKQHPSQADTLYAGVKTLVDPAEMGGRFQVMSLAHSDLQLATGF